VTQTTTASDIRNPFFARLYAHILEPLAARDGNRRRLLADLHGRVVEIGCGAGVNFALYPPTVTEVIAVEPEPYLRERAQHAAKSASVTVQVVAGQADRLPLENESVDAVVSSLVLCSVPDQATALREMRRVLRPGGELRFYEHVIPRCQPRRLLLQIADRSGVWPKVAGGCHPARDTGAAIERGGFQIQSSDRIMFAASAFEPAVPHILGVARRR
jgi:ubiquinone/menaquinone biosynthesis C-methylase UbiE